MKLFHQARVNPGPTLAQPDWPGVSLAPGQGQAEGGLALRARVRASKIGLDLAQPDPWTVYPTLLYQYKRLRSEVGVSKKWK